MKQESRALSIVAAFILVTTFSGAAQPQDHSSHKGNQRKACARQGDGQMMGAGKGQMKE